jgi:hypothetical protein
MITEQIREPTDCSPRQFVLVGTPQNQNETNILLVCLHPRISHLCAKPVNLHSRVRICLLISRISNYLSLQWVSAFVGHWCLNSGKALIAYLLSQWSAHYKAFLSTSGIDCRMRVSLKIHSRCRFLCVEFQHWTFKQSQILYGGATLSQLMFTMIAARISYVLPT